MAKIIDPDDLRVATEITLDTSAKTFTLIAAGNLAAKTGVTLQAVYSKFVDLWTSDTYNKYPFPMYTIDARSGQFIFGFDGSTYNGWVPADDTTREMLRDAGWEERLANGTLDRVYVGIVTLGEVSAGAQLYYQRVAGGTAYNAKFTDEVNQGMLVFDNGSIDEMEYFKIFCREYGKAYDDAILEDVGEAATGAYKIALPVSNSDDLKIQDTDENVAANTPYTGITVEYFEADQHRTIGGVEYHFRVIIEGNDASAEDIYTKIQYLLRQAGDIDAGAGTVVGKTAASLLYFVGETLYTTQGVYIDNYDANDINRIVFMDQEGATHTEPYTAAGNMVFNSYLTAGGTGYYRMYFTDATGDFDYGKADAITVHDATPADIAGTISGASIAWTFAYDSNEQGGRSITPAADVSVTVVAGNAGSAKPVVATYIITRAVGQTISIVAEQDRAYLV